MNSSANRYLYRFVVTPSLSADPRSQNFLCEAHRLGFPQINSLQVSDLYFLRGNIPASDLEKITNQILADPVSCHVEFQQLNLPEASPIPDSSNTYQVEVVFRPGVTDPAAEEFLRAAQMLTAYQADAAVSGLRFVIQGKDLTADGIHLLAKRLLANAVIQTYALGTITPGFTQENPASGKVERIDLISMNSEELLQLSLERRAALNLEEMLAIQVYCQQEQRQLTDVEFEMIAQTWSEHCVHKTFKSVVEVHNPDKQDQRFPEHYTHLFNQTIRAATEKLNKPWVLSAFRDNAGIIAFGEQHELSFKVETHNHPSAIEPFGGANTGVGGVIRDVMGVSARPIAVTDILCVGPQDQPFEQIPEGTLHPHRIATQAALGVQDYSNKIGVPTVNGAIYYDPGYTANPLVFCGCVGLAPRNSHPRANQPGDHVVVLGAKTGRDGLRGATFSSMAMDAQTGEVVGASVQIGDPIVEKGLVDVLQIARDQQLYTAITDCGAGGYASAVGEMASECGAIVQLADVTLKYPGLEPWEIWLSESQERMVIAVPPQNLASLQSLCEKFSVDMITIGQFNASGRIQVYFHAELVLDLDNQFLYHGLPQRKLLAEIRPSVYKPGWVNPENIFPIEGVQSTLLALLAHPNITSKESVIRLYDYEVQGSTVLKPLCGVLDDGPADGCLLKPLTLPGDEAFVLSLAMNPEYGKLDPYQMTLHAIDEAIRNAVCCGADPEKIAILDNFCWGDPTRPETMGDLVQAAQACYDGALRYGTPYISGKDSFNNEYLGSDGLRHAIPATLLISAIGIIPDWRLAMTSAVKQPGNLLYLVGHFDPRFGGSHHNLIPGIPNIPEGLPVCHPHAPQIYQRIYQANQAGWVQSAHDLSEGGLAVAAAEMAIGGRHGLRLWLNDEQAYREAFGETAGCILLEVAPKDQISFQNHFIGLPLRQIGEVLTEPQFEILSGNQSWLSIQLERLVQAWKYQNTEEVQS